MRFLNSQDWKFCYQLFNHINTILHLKCIHFSQEDEPSNLLKEWFADVLSSQAVLVHQDTFIEFSFLNSKIMDWKFWSTFPPKRIISLQQKNTHLKS